MEIYTIGAQRFEPAASSLSGPLGSVRLETRSAEVLAILCRQRGEVISQQDLLDQVWGGRTVSDNSVSIAISNIRRALGDDARRPLQLVTIPKRGYRLNIEELPPKTHSIDTDLKGAVPARRRMGIVAALLFVGLFAICWSLSTTTRLRTLTILPVSNETGSVSYYGLAKALDRVIEQDMTMRRGYRVLEGRNPGADETLKPSLTLWAGKPALSLTVIAGHDNHVLWSAIAEGQPGDMARLTGIKMKDLDRRPPEH